MGDPRIINTIYILQRIAQKDPKKTGASFSGREQNLAPPGGKFKNANLIYLFGASERNIRQIWCAYLI